MGTGQASDLIHHFSNWQSLMFLLNSCSSHFLDTPKFISNNKKLRARAQLPKTGRRREKGIILKIKNLYVGRSIVQQRKSSSHKARK
jgi:hypothetical protein